MARAGMSAPKRHRIAFGFAFDQEHHRARAGQPPGAQRHALRRRLRGIEYGQNIRCVRTGTPVAARKETRGAAVLAKAEQHQVPVADAAQRFRVRECCLARAELGRNRVQLTQWNRYVKSVSAAFPVED